MDAEYQKWKATFGKAFPPAQEAAKYAQVGWVGRWGRGAGRCGGIGGAKEVRGCSLNTV